MLIFVSCVDLKLVNPRLKHFKKYSATEGRAAYSLGRFHLLNSKALDICILSTIKKVMETAYPLDLAVKYPFTNVFLDCLTEKR